MPSVSEKQARFMAAVAHDKGFANRVGVPQKVGQDFNQADKGSELLSRAAQHRANGGAVVDEALTLARQMARQKKPVAEQESTKPVAALAAGGMPEIPYFTRQEAREMSYNDEHPGGLVASAGPGRTDIHNVSVAAGSYVLPADVVSGLGEGNTLNGAKVIDSMLTTGPYGTRMPQIRHGGRGIPHPPPNPVGFSAAEHDPVSFEPPHFASGGEASATIPIVIAGGEYVVHPEQVKKLGGGDIKRGHRILDEFVKHVRKKTVKTLKHLPGPVR